MNSIIQNKTCIILYRYIYIPIYLYGFQFLQISKCVQCHSKLSLIRRVKLQNLSFLQKTVLSHKSFLKCLSTNEISRDPIPITYDITTHHRKLAPRPDLLPPKHQHPRHPRQQHREAPQQTSRPRKPQLHKHRVRHQRKRRGHHIPTKPLCRQRTTRVAVVGIRKVVAHGEVDAVYPDRGAPRGERRDDPVHGWIRGEAVPEHADGEEDRH